MFKLFKKKKHGITSPVKGKSFSVTEANDPTFSSEMLGKGIAIQPEDNTFYAPVDGTIGLVFDTLHAISVTAETGEEIIIHIGLDTVKMGGEGFEAFVKVGDKVKRGDTLLTADLEKIKEAGYDTVTIMVICNTPDFAEVEPVTGISADNDTDVLLVTDK